MKNSNKKGVLFILSIVQNTLIGKSKQSIGNATFTTWKGRNVLKSKPVSVANPQTDAQVMRRSALTQAVALYRKVSGVINAGFNELATTISAYNAFCSYTLKNAFDYSAPPVASFVIDDALISKGSIAQQLLDSVAGSAASNDIVVTWDASTLQPGQSVNDKLLAVVINNTSDVTQGYVTSVARSAETATLSFSDGLTLADDCDVLVGFISSDGNKSSDSVYTNIAVGA